MLQVMSLIEPKRLAVDCGSTDGSSPQYRREPRHRAGLRIEYPRHESRRCGERAALGKRPTRSGIAVPDREQRFHFVLARQREAFLDKDPLQDRQWAPQAIAPNAS